MRATRSARLSRTMKSSPFFLNASTGAGRALVGGAPDAVMQPALAGEVGVLLGAGQRELLLDDALGQDEPGIVVAGRHDVLQLCRACRSPGTAARAAACRCASNHIDDGPGRMRMPWRGQIGFQFSDALDVVPHPVAVDQPRAGGLGDADHAAVDMFGHAGDHAFRRLAQPLRPVLPDQVVIAADAAGGDDHRLRAQREIADHLARASSCRARRCRLRAPRR